VRDLAGFSKKKKIREKIVLKLFDNREVQKNHPQSFVCTRRPCTRLEKKIFLHEKQTKRKKKKKKFCHARPAFFFPLSSVSFINPDARQSPTKEKKKKKTPDVPFLFIFVCYTAKKR
jgi:hypothetical protein